MKVLVTGVSGYIGKLLAEKLISKGIEVIGIDREPLPQSLLGKIEFLQKDLAREDWENDVKADAVVHCAFEIKSRYGKIDEQRFNNIEMSRRVFDWAFKNDIKKLVYLSSAAAYGAKEENVGKFLKETEPLEEKTYPYGSHKREVEEIFHEMDKKNTKSYFLRLGTVNGEEGKKRTNSLLTFVRDSFVLPYGSKDSSRQYVNEKDVVNAMIFLLDYDGPQFDVFNLAPDDYLQLNEMAKKRGKLAIRIPVWMVRVGFFLNWHVLRGKIFATAPGSWRSYVYPSNIDGNKIKSIGYEYLYDKSEPTFLGR